ncbi:hypothetical protein P148_SR1C00001G0916 [candidate division SR1 bacterium RAAC1_SR1_1]|nr:hypothetical protein P148_SR1C00001G0916 [candidate division SR1 bacterium RAAC1_SR1_1]
MKKFGTKGIPLGRIVLSAFGLLFLVGCTQQAPVETQEVPQGKISAEQDVLSLVASHADATSCWTVISGNVYDLTSWIGKHPGGDKAILASCGIDATEMFDEKHGMDPKKREGLKSFEVMVK